MTTAEPADLSAHLDAWVPEPAAARAARDRAGEVGVTPVPTLAGAALRFLAAVTGARAVAEVGTGTGVSGLWLLDGMRPDGVLTTIDSESEHQRLARAAFADAEVAAGRVRLIAGRAQEVLPRLSDGGYDLVHLDTPPAEALDLVAEAVRVLRPGGVLAISRVLAGGRAVDRGSRDAEAVAARGVARAVREDERLQSALLALPGAGDALLVAVRTAAAQG